MRIELFNSSPKGYDFKHDENYSDGKLRKVLNEMKPIQSSKCALFSPNSEKLVRRAD